MNYKEAEANNVALLSRGTTAPETGHYRYRSLSMRVMSLSATFDDVTGICCCTP